MMKHLTKMEFLQRRRSRVTFRLGELFCGAGGLALGAFTAFEKKGCPGYSIRHVWANDYQPDACATYAYNLCVGSSSSVICQDVRTLNIRGLTPIDAFAYGFPCNDFSVVGEQKGIHGSFGPLYSYGLDVLNYFKPKFFVAENVGGLASANQGFAFRKILSDLQNAGNGYRLTVHLYKFEDYGVPQTRHRIIIVGIDRSFGLTFQVPSPTCCTPVSARFALECPPISESVANHELTAQSKTVVDRLTKIKPGENAWTANLPDSLKLNVKGARLSQIYRRLHPDLPAYTITGSGGGGTHCYHWSEPRALTNRERARLQTFPDDFVFMGSKESVRKQIGMAVPPHISRLIFSCILKTFAGISYSHIPSSWNGQLELFDSFVEKGGG